ncbi:MAG TPA: RcnB family protein [Phenylobacterium sp.]|nr:RcnB family protein [Phenylobacterium sp.]
MKRLILSLAAVATIAGPMAASASAAHAQSWDRHDNGRHNGWDRGYGRDRDGDRRDWDRRDWDRYDRRDRDRDGGWDRGRHNGYYYNNRWYYGPPPQAYYGNPYYRPGYTAWRRGGVLPSYYRSYYVNDYYRYHLRPPPRGYAWYRVGDDYLLAAIATGLIFEIINN